MTPGLVTEREPGRFYMNLRSNSPCKALRSAFIVSLLLLRLPAMAMEPALASPELWDTGTHLGDSVDVSTHDGWRAVPTDLLSLEANPPKASSDPGYYGREYAFRGDAAVENQKVLAIFWASKGTLLLYSKSGSAGTTPVNHSDSKVLTKILELTAADPESGGSAESVVLCNAADKVVLEFRCPGNRGLRVEFDSSEVVYVRPTGELKRVRLRAPVEYAIAPSFIGDDLVFGGLGKAPSVDTPIVPAENMLLALLTGEANELVITWPSGKQQVSLETGPAADARRPIGSVLFDTDGKGFCLASISAPGVWHTEKLSAAYLEKDVTSEWKRPFAARWKTELYEEQVTTTFAFHQNKGEIWRGVPGSYDYPVWFEGDQAFFHLGKKVPPKGEAVIYFLEGQGTPATISTPAAVLQSTLGRTEADPILDLAGRKLRTHHRRGGDGVHRACTCGCTEAIQAVFESHEEVQRKDDIRADLEDMVFFVHAHVNRIGEYQRFAEEMVRFLDANKASSPDLSEYLDGLKQTIQQIPQEWSVQKENMKSSPYADDLVKRTLALTDKQDPDNLKAYLELLKDWRAMGGAQDYVLAQCHTVTRKFSQEAGYNCVGQAKAAALAKEIRTRTRAILRNPDGYEIWADY